MSHCSGFFSPCRALWAVRLRLLVQKSHLAERCPQERHRGALGRAKDPREGKGLHLRSGREKQGQPMRQAQGLGERKSEERCASGLGGGGCVPRNRKAQGVSGGGGI